MGYFLDVAKDAIVSLFLVVLSACAALSPDASIWVLSSFGSTLSVFYGRPRRFMLYVRDWSAGTFFSVAWVVGIDHFQPQAEAVAVGLISSALVRIWLDKGPSIIFNRVTGKQISGGHAE